MRTFYNNKHVKFTFIQNKNSKAKFINGTHSLILTSQNKMYWYDRIYTKYGLMQTLPFSISDGFIFPWRIKYNHWSYPTSQRKLCWLNMIAHSTKNPKSPNSLGNTAVSIRFPNNNTDD